MNRRRSSLVVAPGVALFAAATLAACGSDEPKPTHQAVCVVKDPQGVERRADDEKEKKQCEGGGGSGGFIYSHVFYSPGRTVPPVGANLRSYGGHQRTLPAGKVAAWGTPPRAGEKVSTGTIKSAATRGGFGSTSASAKGSVGG